jgi:hypothetical protein
MGATVSGERMQLVTWTRLRKNSLFGFATVSLPIGLTLIDCPVLESNGRRWATLPSKAQIEDGQQRRDANGKPAYSPLGEWQSKKLRDAFSDRIISLVLERDPGAFT